MGGPGMCADQVTVSGTDYLPIVRSTTGGPLTFGHHGGERGSPDRNYAAFFRAFSLRKRVAKLVRTPADKRILLLERDQMALAEGQIYGEVVKLAPGLPDLAGINEIWIGLDSGHRRLGLFYADA
jgi:hypothetical protein